MVLQMKMKMKMIWCRDLEWDKVLKAGTTKVMDSHVSFGLKLLI